MTPDQKGSIAETAIIHAAVKLAIGVSKPITDGHRYDLIFELPDRRLLRVQCKTAVCRRDIICVPCYSARRSPAGLLKRLYTIEEIDAIAAYAPELERCYLIPSRLVAARTYIQLRLAPTRNNQRQLVNWAEDFEFERLNWADLGP